jgi:tetratricopeptide (TPR) repeat protein
MTTRLAFSTLLLSAVLLPGPDLVSAQDGGDPGADVGAERDSDESEAGRVHYESGRAHFESGRYERALEEFEAALEASGRSELEYNIGLCHERLGNYGEAADHLEAYLATQEEPDAALQERVQNLRRRQAEADAQAASQQQSQVADPDLEAADESGGVPVSAIVSYGVAGAGLAVFGIFGALALAEDGSLASSCGADAGRTCTGDDVSTMKTFGLVADVGLGVAIAGAVVGTILLFIGGGDDDGEGDGAEVAVAPAVGPNVLGLSAQGAF